MVVALEVLPVVVLEVAVAASAEDLAAEVSPAVDLAEVGKWQYLTHYHCLVLCVK